jgi:hypothetical protein
MACKFNINGKQKTVDELTDEEIEMLISYFLNQNYISIDEIVDSELEILREEKEQRLKRGISPMQLLKESK